MTRMRPGIDYVGVSTPFYCNDGKGTFVLHRRSDACRDERGRWDFGSGTLEFGEEPHQSALREMQEEYGISGRIQEQLPAHSLLREVDGVLTHWVIIPFLILTDIYRAQIIEPSKVTELGFFTLETLPRPLHSGVEKALRLYNAQIWKYHK